MQTAGRKWVKIISMGENKLKTDVSMSLTSLSKWSNKVQCLNYIKFAKENYNDKQSK